ncbi:helix-turn-helix transcriptional regulator [Paenibacillus barcinonensis]|uniref:AraC-like DNA-binding protein n=1 Tax=Paenibacillus barcinonensis TaxID=198119 RepID=A0A2V4V5L7_PAEBA|nr:AraC family transcriptional regulator [Paenibacillus barcinonensis]PYE47583.1 AraC-like DNA-binding protein [Paenibacillus barcinonensis]QKS58464.1 helix-turn-helix transcriptional regulator [Paenibacillus barcinonensis]
MLAFRLTGRPDSRMPLYLYGVGTQEEKGLHRPDGFPVYQLFMARGGGGRFNIAGRAAFVIEAGQLFVLEPGIAHEYIPHPKTNGELAYIGIGGDATASVLQAAGMVRREACTVSGFDVMWSRMTDLWKALDPGKMSMWSTSALVYQFILELAQVTSPEAASASLAAEPKIRRSFTGVDSAVQESSMPGMQLHSDAGMDGLNRAIALMQAHYQDDLLFKHVADAAGYSVQHLNRLFHQHYGVTGHQYMQRWRLHKGLEWMNEHPQASVKEAAENVGMEVNYFIRMYKREFGETPGKGVKQRNQLKLEQSVGSTPQHWPESAGGGLRHKN